MALTAIKYRIFLCVALCFIYLAILFVIVGLTTNYWLEIRTYNSYDDDVEMHFGLHRVCWSRSDRCNNPSGNYDKHNFLPIVQGLVITGSVLGLSASLLALVNFFCEMLELNLKLLTIATVVVSVLAGLFLMIGCALFSEKIEIGTGYGTMFDRYAFRGYSFGLTTCAGSMMWVGAILISVANFCGKSEDDKNLIPRFPPGTPNSFGPRSIAPSYIS